MVVETGQFAYRQRAEIDVLIEELFDQLAECVGLGRRGI